MSKLKIGIQKSGKLYNGSIDLLNRADIKFDQTKNQLIHLSKNFPLEIYFLRNSDIPKYVEDGVLDIAIIGNNQLLESGSDIKITEKLGFSKCRLSLAIPKDKLFSDIGFFENKLIATSLPKKCRSPGLLVFPSIIAWLNFSDCCQESLGSSMPVNKKIVWTNPEQSNPPEVLPPHL